MKHALSLIWGLSALLLGSFFVVGCASSDSPLIRREPQLEKPATELAADAAKRSYPAAIPVGGDVKLRAQVDYTLNYLQIYNLSKSDWADVEVWVNRQWVVHLQSLPGKKFTHISFGKLFDRNGKRYSEDHGYIKQLQLVHQGKIYNIRHQLTD